MLMAVVLYRMAPALLASGVTVSAPNGDGLGGMSWNYCMGLFIREFGWSAYLQDDIFNNPYFGGGLNPKAVYFQPWKIVYGFLSQHLGIDQVWDFVLFVGIALTALASYWVAILLKIRPFFAFLGTILLISMENIDARITGHNTLAFWFAPMLQWGCMILWCRSFSWYAVIALSLISVVSLASNEYLAWYGGLFVAAYGLVQLYGKLRAGKIPVARLVFQAVTALVVTGGLVRGIFPSMFGGLYQVVAKKPSPSDYNLFALRTPGSILVPNVLVEFNWLDRRWHGVKGEMTFRLGLVFWGSFAYVVARYRKLSKTVTMPNRMTVQSLVIAGVFLLACALPLSSFPWVSLFFAKALPMFRSILRAMLFFNVAMVFLFVIMLQALFDHCQSKGETRKFLTILACGIPIILFDMGPFRRNFGPYPTYSLPVAEASELALAKEESGLVLELPIEDRANDKGRDPFMMHRFTLHHKPILNWLVSSIPGPYEHAYEYLRQQTRLDPARLVGEARRLGARYLLVENQLRAKIPPDGIEEIAAGPERTAFRIKHSQEISVSQRQAIFEELNRAPLLVGPYHVP
jgi:hypothetical protein